MIAVFKKGSTDFLRIEHEASKVNPKESGITLATADLQLKCYLNPRDSHEQYLKDRAMIAISKLSEGQGA